MARTLAQPDLVSLAAGFVDYESLPVEPVRRAMEAIFGDSARAHAALQYGTTIGHGPLRAAVLERMLCADGRTAAELGLSPDRVVMTAGSNQLLFMVSDALLDPGDIVLCGAPTYFVYLGTIENLGARAFGVACDEHGLVPEALDDALARLAAAGELGRVKAIYVTTYYDNPSGVSVPAARRAAIIELAQRWSRSGRIYVIEDAAYRELRYAADDIPSLRSFDAAGDTVVHAGTFSKSFSPGVRVGWGILPPALLGPVLAAKGHIDFGSPNFNQLLMATVLELGLYDDHLVRLRAQYKQKLDATLRAAEAHLRGIEGVDWVAPTGGLYLWLRLPPEIDTGLEGPLFDRAVAEGVLYIPGEHCYPGHGTPRPRNMIRLSFGIPSAESIARGVAALGRAIRQVAGRARKSPC
jgi:2-aminoadipate transaminase